MPSSILARAAGLALVSAIVCGCAGYKQYLKQGFSPPETIAILLMDNYTTDLDGPAIVRYWFDQRITEKKGYRTLPLEEVESKLKELGITDGGQLGSVTLGQLGEKLGVSAVVYGDLLNFDYKTTGFLNVRKVKARFKMMDCKTGEVLWEGEGLGANSSGALSSSEALKAGLKQLGDQFVEKAFRSPLRNEVLDMIWNAIEYLPKADYSQH